MSKTLYLDNYMLSNANTNEEKQIVFETMINYDINNTSFSPCEIFYIIMLYIAEQNISRENIVKCPQMINKIDDVHMILLGSYSIILYYYLNVICY